MKEHCNIALLPLSQGQYAIVDIADFEYLNQWKWYVFKDKCKTRTKYYVQRTQHIGMFNGKQKQKIFRMHRQLLNFPKDLVVDHVDGNPLNNCRHNLKIVTKRQNSQNRRIKKTSKYVGVDWVKSRKRWRASIRINGKRKQWLFIDEEKAHKKYIKECEAL